KPPLTSPSVGKAGFGVLASTTRGVPSQLGAVQGPMLVAKVTNAPGTVTRPLVPPKAITGMSMAGAGVRFSMSRRPRPTESAPESRLIAWLQSASAMHTAPTLPVEQKPSVHTPATLVTLGPAFGKYQSVKLLPPA